MLRALFISFVTAVTLAAPVARAQDDDANALFDAMGLPEIMDVMRQEGIDYGDTIARDMFPSGMTPRWADAVAEIYDADTMVAQMRAAFVAALGDGDAAAMLAFYQSDLGRRVVTLEIDARRAMLDPALEDAAKQMAAQALQDDTDRAQMITDFISANNLIEANVVGALNSNYAFISGLVSGGATLPGLMADDILADVWDQEPEIRATTTEWLYAFLMLAYEPLPDADLAEFSAMTQTTAGRDLTAALFIAFDDLFEQVSRDLGVAASAFIVSQEL
ncbi:DUF2059 domain-containing protein [Yoonia sp.]|uniref:DUF2059 domain-containing protein n=1 Tax=Yoonia sp. TaxID=2212373 RepID=UPI00391D20CB